MSAYTMRCSRSSFPWLLIIVFAAAAAGLVLGTHALKHSLADTVRNCPDDRIGLILSNLATGRKVILCEYEPGQWGRIIEENGYEVTSYANKRAASNTLEHVIRSMVRSGYSRIEYIRPELSDIIAKILAIP